MKQTQTRRLTQLVGLTLTALSSTSLFAADKPNILVICGADVGVRERDEDFKGVPVLVQGNLLQIRKPTL